MKQWIMLAAVIAIGGCQYAKPACAVIDIVDHVCDYVTITYVDQDGTVRQQRVPVAMVRDAAMRARRDGVGQ